MSELVIAEIAAPARDTDPGAVLTVLRKIHDFQQASDIARHGHDDQTEPVDLALGELQHNPNRPRFRLVALLDALPETMSIGSHGLPLLAADTDLGAATVVGVADLVLPMSDNRFAVWDVELEVDGGHRRRGIGRALAQAVDRVAVASERNLIQAWTNSSIAGPDDPDALVAPGSGYRLARDAGARFALAMGLRPGPGRSAFGAGPGGQEFHRPHCRRATASRPGTTPPTRASCHYWPTCSAT